jgi:hypothetical protein
MLRLPCLWYICILSGIAPEVTSTEMENILHTPDKVSLMKERHDRSSIHVVAHT